MDQSVLMPPGIETGGWPIARAWALWLAAGAAMPVLSAFDSRRLWLTGALALCVLYALGRRRFVVARLPLAVAATAVAVLGLVSAVIHAAPAWSVLGVAYTGLCALAISALAYDLASAPVAPARLVGLGFVLPVALCCFVACAAVYAALLSGFALVYPEPLRNFANIRFFNQYQTWTLAFVTAALGMACPVPRVGRVFWTVFVVALAVLFWALFWRSSGRGTGYATLAATAAVGVFFGRPGRVHARRTLALAAAGYLVAWLMFGHSGGSASAHLVSAASPGRWYLWGIAIAHIKTAPWLGMGPMLFAAIDNGVASHPHDAPLQWAAEWGLPAAALLLACIAWLLYRWLRIARLLVARPETTTQASALVVAVTASLIAGSLHALVSGVIVMPASQFMLVTVASLAAGIAARQAGKPSMQIPRPSVIAFRRLAARIFSMLVLAAVAYTCVFTLYDYRWRSHHLPPKTAVYRRNSLQPRYWADATLTGLVDWPAAKHR